MADGSGANGLHDIVEHVFKFDDSGKLARFCGPLDMNLVAMEKNFGIQILRHHQGLLFQFKPSQYEASLPKIMKMIDEFEDGQEIDTIMLGFQNYGSTSDVVFMTPKKPVEGKTHSQHLYAANLMQHELNFGMGPAGTGKTYLAVAAGVHMLTAGSVDRIILSRPAVEAGERLGFLPGDMKDKVDPYMQPLYDALNDMLPAKVLTKMMTDKTIEIAPLAFMRGRTLSRAFVLLDEAQNASSMQMKMFLTRLGRGSRMVITGDPGQTDLPKGTISGLSEAARILKGEKGIGFTAFSNRDVVRHPLVARILNAYERDKDHDA